MIKKLRSYGVILGISMLIGLLSGTINTLFGKVLLAIGDIRNLYFFYLVPFLGLIGLLILFLYQKWGKNAQKGMTLVFEVGQGSTEAIPKRLIPFVMVTTWLTHLFGGSAGREGVAVQIGATIASQFKSYFSQPKEQQLLLLIGMAAGFAGLFQTPLAASFFAIEVLIVGHYSWRALIPALVAAYTASTTSHLLGLEKFQHPLSESISLSPVLIGQLLLLAIAFAVVGNLFALLLSLFKTKLATIIPNPYWRIAIVGAGISLLMILLHQGRYAGLGTNLIEASFDRQTIYLYDWLLKLLLTVLTLSVGFQGGEVTPLFAIGASAGIVLASLLGLPLAFAAALGYIAVFGVATNTLLAPIFIGIEVFGWSYAPAYLFVVALAYSLNRQYSIYSAQKMNNISK